MNEASTDPRPLSDEYFKAGIEIGKKINVINKIMLANDRNFFKGPTLRFKIIIIIIKLTLIYIIISMVLM